jgi:hypothetical protein
MQNKQNESTNMRGNGTMNHESSWFGSSNQIVTIIRNTWTSRAEYKCPKYPEICKGLKSFHTATSS